VPYFFSILHIKTKYFGETLERTGQVEAVP